MECSTNVLVLDNMYEITCIAEYAIYILPVVFNTCIPRTKLYIFLLEIYRLKDHVFLTRNNSIYLLADVQHVKKQKRNMPSTYYFSNMYIF